MYTQLKDTDRSCSHLLVRKAMTCREGQSVSVNAIENAMRMITHSVTSRYAKL